MNKVTKEEMDYLFSKIDFSKSFLDAKAINIMNRVDTLFIEDERIKHNILDIDKTISKPNYLTYLSNYIEKFEKEKQFSILKICVDFETLGASITYTQPTQPIKNIKVDL